MGTINEVATLLGKAWDAAVRNDDLAENGLRQSGLTETALGSGASGLAVGLMTLSPSVFVLAPVVSFALATGGLRLINEYRIENANKKPPARGRNMKA